LIRRERLVAISLAVPVCGATTKATRISCSGLITVNGIDSAAGIHPLGNATSLSLFGNLTWTSGASDQLLDVP
jgi:hypothetical protein